MEDEHICPNCGGSDVAWIGEKLKCFDCNTDFDEEEE